MHGWDLCSHVLWSVEHGRQGKVRGGSLKPTRRRRYVCSNSRWVRKICSFLYYPDLPPWIIRISAVAVASEIAALRPDVQGPGTFLPAFIDELSKLTPEILSEKVNVGIIS